jgi:hypothetical protein
MTLHGLPENPVIHPTPFIPVSPFHLLARRVRFPHSFSLHMSLFLFHIIFNSTLPRPLISSPFGILRVPIRVLIVFFG